MRDITELKLLPTIVNSQNTCTKRTMEPSMKKLKPSFLSNCVTIESNVVNTINLITLPDIVLMKILTYLPYFPDVFHNVARVCKKFNIFANDLLLPERLVINPDMFKGTNYKQILKIVARSARIRQLQVDLQPAPYFTEFDIRSLTCDREDNILKLFSDKKVTLRNLKVGINALGSWYTPSIDFIQRVSTSLVNISQNNNIEVLQLGIPISENTLVKILNNVKNTLKSFKIQDLNFLLVNEEAFGKLCECSFLEELIIDLNDNKIEIKSNEGLPKLDRLVNLKRLTLSAGVGSNASVSNLSNTFMKKLESLYLVNYAVDEHSIENIRHCDNLKEIEVTLNGCCIDDLLSKISKLRHVEKLIIHNGTFLSAAGTKLISTFDALKEMRLKGITKFKDLTPTNLSELFISPSLQALIILEFDITILNDNCLMSIGETCKNLEVFKITGCRNVSDCGLKELAKNCPELREVSLQKCTNISDNGVKCLIEHCKRLQKLFIKYTSVSKQYCDSIFSTKLEIVCAHRNCINYRSDSWESLMGMNDYDDDSYTFKDYRYRR